MQRGEWWSSNVSGRFNNARPLSRERGQTFLVIAVFIAVFLLGVLGLATDYAQVWAHRQMAQGAADAACQAASADLLLKFQDPTAPSAFPQVNFGWMDSAPFDCSTNAGSPPCAYAALNGYSGSKVAVSLPDAASLPFTPPPIPAGFGAIPHKYIKVKITDPVPMSFTKLVSSTATVSVTASAFCGMLSVNSPTPITVLNPTVSGALSVGGSG